MATNVCAQRLRHCAARSGTCCHVPSIARVSTRLSARCSISPSTSEATSECAQDVAHHSAHCHPHSPTHQALSTSPTEANCTSRNMLYCLHTSRGQSLFSSLVYRLGIQLSQQLTIQLYARLMASLGIRLARRLLAALALPSIASRLAHLSTYLPAHAAPQCARHLTIALQPCIDVHRPLGLLSHQLVCLRLNAHSCRASTSAINPHAKWSISLSPNGPSYLIAYMRSHLFLHTLACWLQTTCARFSKCSPHTGVTDLQARAVPNGAHWNEPHVDAGLGSCQNACMLSDSIVGMHRCLSVHPANWLVPRCLADWTARVLATWCPSLITTVHSGVSSTLWAHPRASRVSRIVAR